MVARGDNTDAGGSFTKSRCQNGWNWKSLDYRKWSRIKKEKRNCVASNMWDLYLGVWEGEGHETVNGTMRETQTLGEEERWCPAIKYTWRESRTHHLGEGGRWAKGAESVTRGTPQGVHVMMKKNPGSLPWAPSLLNKRIWLSRKLENNLVRV